MQCDVVTQNDPFNLTTYGETLNCSPFAFKVKSLWKARTYDIIHTHSLEGIGKFIKHIWHGKKVVMHFHGSDIRGKWSDKEQYWKCADKVLVSTEDLLQDAPSDATYLPNPVDTELFYPQEVALPHTAFHFSYGADDLAQDFASHYNLKLTIHDRTIPHLKLADELCRYEYYIDARRVNDQVIECLSKTGLEALACGCKVVDWRGNVTQGLPQIHRPENVAKELYSIYERLCEP